MKISNSIILILLITVSLTMFSSCKPGMEKTDEKADMDKMNHDEMKNMEACNNMMSSMNGMMSKMNAMEMSHDQDHDFAHMMIEHHQGAIDMAKVEIASGIDEKVKGMAQQMLTMQMAEQEKLRTFIAGHKVAEHTDKTAGHSKEQQNDHSAMMQKMENKMKGMTMSGDVDKDFVMMMIPHHESAVSMAEMEIANGHQDDIKQMAQQMKMDQEKEIKEMQMWLDNHK